MKSLAIRTLLVIAAVVGFAVAPAAQAQVGVNVTIGGFYDELAPYGRWVDCSYGQCWVPARVAADWQPYSNGQWIYTEYGWTWVSEDPWGGSPYHYGTWTSIQGYGWSWVPGTVWAPAWVTWNYSNDYVGWAPLPPTVVFGASGYSGSPVVVTRTQYVFVPTNRFVGRNVASVRVAPGRSAEIFRQTRPVTGFAVTGGIVRNTSLPMATIERAGGKIETRSIEAARTAPRAMSTGSAHVSVVAPASEVRAAAAARPQTAARASEPSRDEKHAAPASPEHEAKAARSSDPSQANKHGRRLSSESQTAEREGQEGPASPPMESHHPRLRIRRNTARSRRLGPTRASRPHTPRNPSPNRRRRSRRRRRRRTRSPTEETPEKRARGGYPLGRNLRGGRGTGLLAFAHPSDSAGDVVCCSARPSGCGSCTA